MTENLLSQIGWHIDLQEWDRDLNSISIRKNRRAPALERKRQDILASPNSKTMAKTSTIY
ncbi:MAG: hypothetical protein DMG06_25215 [Acidobacteria bacterium]|nr:MAG: hypothetical protein DMG06_25215 [Acidobacteriota bacterium]